MDKIAPMNDALASQYVDGPAVAAWHKRMGENEAEEIYKQRATAAECVNAQAHKPKLTQFLVRSVAKVKTIALWRAQAHNMICSWPLLDE